MTSLEGVRMTELINEPLGAFRLLHNTLAIVLAYGATQLIVIHSWPVLTLSPKTGNSNTVFDLKDPSGTIQPADCGSVHCRLREKLLQELPQVNVGAVG